MMRLHLALVALLGLFLASCSISNPTNTTDICGGRGQVCCIPPLSALDGAVFDAHNLSTATPMGRMDGGRITSACDPGLSCVAEGATDPPRCEPCPTGEVECGGQCTVLARDANNCGTCGHVCPSGNVCSAGMCGTSCVSGQVVCTVGTTATCRDLTSDPANCGACGHPCVSGQDCAGGVCTCPTAASSLCNAGTSTAGCRNLTTDPANCGMCDHACVAGQMCSMGTCSATCALPLTTCMASSGNYCANTSNDPANCGMCGRPCRLANTVTDGCTASTCNVVTCSMGWGDCDGVESNGCETDTTTSLANCGACGRLCALPHAATSACTMGSCGITACTTGFADCNHTAADGCEVNTQADNANCGACGTTCPSGQVCSGGHCGTTCATPLAICAGPPSYCANFANDPANCGMCGTVCNLAHATVSTCAAGACAVTTCAMGFADCDHLASTGCEANLNTDSANCGACARACSLPNATSVCTSGACAVNACASGYLDCNHMPADGCEVNTQTDSLNCGSCGHTCASGQVCSHGLCTASCGTPLTTCGTVPSLYCANVSIDPANCGSCTNACALPNTAANGCASGACTVIRCNASFGDCDGVAGNGCETNLTTSTPNCGACGAACHLANAVSTCSVSTCHVTTCNGGYADCDGTAADGCEVNTQTDSGNCGACSHACGAGQVCSMGSCTATCASPLTTCGTAPSQYCANTSNDPANCGTCSHSCTGTNVVTNGCNASTCIIIACATNTGDCNHRQSDGCEANLQTDSGNCGACGVACMGGQSCVAGACVCPTGQTFCGGVCVNTLTDSTNCGVCGHGCVLADASSTCTAGVCAITTCGTGYADCNHTAADGCEVNTQTDSSNCGACGMACAAGTFCSRGTCSTTCASPLSTCGTAPSQYCANIAIDPANCGSCGSVCALAHVSTDGCSARLCTIITCAAGYGDCDGIAGNGCETNLNTTLADCGACGRACALANASSSCTAGACGIASCNTGFADCNHSAADGCEASLQSDNANCGACGHTCAAGTVCSGGACTTTCASPLTTCSGYCANTSNDPSNCSACGTVCALTHTTADGCVSSACTVGTCSAGFGDCDGIASNGCETSLASTTADCGACGHACSLANATAACTASACTISSCSAGYFDCDHSASDGCEVNGNTDNTNCGACGHGCPGGQACFGGLCTTTCGSPTTLCSGACVDYANDPSNCGSCGHVCSPAAHQAAVCLSSTCAFVCNAGFADCNGIASDGCEADLSLNTHCGTCTNVCNVSVAPSLTCTANSGSPGGYGCLAACGAPGFSCCGGTLCANGSMCTSGTCTCPAGFPTTCGTSTSATCVNTTTDSSNCGACGTVCTGTGTSCVAGVCCGASGQPCCTSGTACATGMCNMTTNLCP